MGDLFEESLLKAMTGIKFSKKLKEKGFEQYKNKNARYWKDIGVYTIKYYQAGGKRRQEDDRNETALLKAVTASSIHRKGPTGIGGQKGQLFILTLYIKTKRNKKERKEEKKAVFLVHHLL